MCAILYMRAFKRGATEGCQGAGEIMTGTVTARFGLDLVNEVDEARGEETRSSFIETAVRQLLRARKLSAMCDWAQRTAAEDAQMAEVLLDSLDGPIPE